MKIQTEGFWRDATKFLYGPFIAVASPDRNQYRIERANVTGVGSCHLSGKEYEVIAQEFGRSFYWEELSTLEPVIVWLNDRVKLGQL